MSCDESNLQQKSFPFLTLFAHIQMLMLFNTKSDVKYPHIVITTYGLVSSHISDLNALANAFQEKYWCYCVLDEGHCIKNASTKISKDVRILCRNKETRRLLLTGTPVQNNLRELYCLFDWATSGNLLGSLRT